MGHNDIRGVDLNLLVVFDALFDERSVTKAAQRLALTQSTVSGLLKKLRQLFDDELFVRSSHGIVPTPRAEALSTPVKEVLASIGELLAPEAFDPKNAAFTVRLSGSDYLQQSIIRDFTIELMKNAPKARIAVLPRPATGVADLLARGELDFALGFQDAVVADLPARRLYQDRFVCLSSYEDMTNDTHLTPEELCEYIHAFVDPTGGSFRGPVDSAFSRSGLSRTVALTVPTFPMLLDLMKERELLAFMPEKMARSAGHRFASISTSLETPPIEVFANWHPRMRNDQRHIWLRTVMAKVAKFASL